MTTKVEPSARLAGLLTAVGKNAGMATVSRTVHASPEKVFAVLGDGWLYGLWVVAASRIRDVEPA